MQLTTVSVREAVPADLDRLDALVTQTLSECLGDALPPAELEACSQAYRMRGATERCYVAESRGALMGYAVVSNGKSSASACGAVRRLYVSHAPGGTADDRYVATALVSAAFSDREVPLTANRDTALELYDRWGFVDVEALQRCLSAPSGLGRMMR